MKKQSYSFFNLVTINIGTMVGVGIFFKNTGILKTTNNIWLALATWIIGGILVYGLGLSFAEAHSYTHEQGISGTVPNWLRVFVGKSSGRKAAHIISWFAFPAAAVLLVYYAVYFLLYAFGWNDAMIELHWRTIFVITLFAYFVLAAANALSYNFGKILQAVGTIIKFIPLLAVCILGFTTPVVASNANTFSGQVFGNPQTWNVASILVALPAVFFAFEGFMGGLSLSKEEKNPGDAMKATLFSIVAIAIFYVVFAAAVGFGTSDGSLFAILSNSFGKTGANIIWVIIAISAYTVANGLLIFTARQMKAASDAQDFLPSKLLSKVESDGRHKGQTWVLFALGTLYLTFNFVVSEALKISASPDKVGLFTKAATFDNLGNTIALFTFTLYALVGFGVFANRFSQNFKVKKQKFIILQLLASLTTFYIVVTNTINYFLAENKITMWLIILVLFIIWSTDKITSLGQKQYK